MRLSLNLDPASEPRFEAVRRRADASTRRITYQGPPRVRDRACFVSSRPSRRFLFFFEMVGEEFFDVVDETTLETTHQELRSVVHRTGLLHRAVRVLGSWFLGSVGRSVGRARDGVVGRTKTTP